MSEFELNGETLIIGKTRSGKYNPFNPTLVAKILNKEEIKTIIHDFYKSEPVEFDLENVEAECRNFMWDLFKELASKEEKEGLNDMETILFLFLSKDLSKNQDLEYVFSDHLVNEFKNVLKEVL